MNTFTSKVTCLAISLVFVGVIPGKTSAQRTTLPDIITRPNPSPAIISDQIRLAVKLGNRALAGLQTGPDRPELEAPVQTARDCYVLIRAARTGLEARKARRSVTDPLLDLTIEQTTLAWNLARTPVDRFVDGITVEEYRRVAVRDLSQAIEILEEVLMLMP